MPVEKIPLADRFWKKVDKSGDCWTWTASINDCGYGQMGVRTKFSQRAHRISWELHFGPIPEGVSVLHRCDNPSCVRPDHLFLGTQKDNMADATKKARRFRGESSGVCKLTNAQAAEIRSIPYSTIDNNAAVGRRFGISDRNVREIREGRTWRILDFPDHKFYNRKPYGKLRDKAVAIAAAKTERAKAFEGKSEIQSA